MERIFSWQYGCRRIWLYTLHTDEVKNQKYTWALLQSMEQLEIQASQTPLIILGPEDETDNRYQAKPDRYGYGTVIPASEPELVARTLIRAYPPYERMEFDTHGKAKNNFHRLIIGDGHSAKLYRYLSEHMDTLSCIALCTGSEVMNKEIADDLWAFLMHRGCNKDPPHRDAVR